MNDIEGEMQPVKGGTKRVQTPFCFFGGGKDYSLFFLCVFFCGCFCWPFFVWDVFVLFVSVFFLWGRICVLEMTVYHVGKTQNAGCERSVF